jgi:hypothetical protein
MRTAERYRRFGQECAEAARTAKSPANKAVLLHMAQVAAPGTQLRKGCAPSKAVMRLPAWGPTARIIIGGGRSVASLLDNQAKCEAAHTSLPVPPV